MKRLLTIIPVLAFFFSFGQTEIPNSANVAGWLNVGDSIHGSQGALIENIAPDGTEFKFFNAPYGDPVQMTVGSEVETPDGRTFKRITTKDPVTGDYSLFDAGLVNSGYFVSIPISASGEAFLGNNPDEPFFSFFQMVDSTASGTKILNGQVALDGISYIMRRGDYLRQFDLEPDGSFKTTGSNFFSPTGSNTYYAEINSTPIGGTHISATDSLGFYQVSGGQFTGEPVNYYYQQSYGQLSHNFSITNKGSETLKLFPGISNSTIMRILGAYETDSVLCTGCGAGGIDLVLSWNGNNSIQDYVKAIHGGWSHKGTGTIGTAWVEDVGINNDSSGIIDNAILWDGSILNRNTGNINNGIGYTVTRMDADTSYVWYLPDGVFNNNPQFRYGIKIDEDSIHNRMNMLHLTDNQSLETNMIYRLDVVGGEGFDSSYLSGAMQVSGETIISSDNMAGLPYVNVNVREQQGTFEVTRYSATSDLDYVNFGALEYAGNAGAYFGATAYDTLTALDGSGLNSMISGVQLSGVNGFFGDFRSDTTITQFQFKPAQNQQQAVYIRVQGDNDTINTHRDNIFGMNDYRTTFSIGDSTSCGACVLDAKLDANGFTIDGYNVAVTIDNDITLYDANDSLPAMVAPGSYDAPAILGDAASRDDLTNLGEVVDSLLNIMDNFYNLVVKQ